MDDSQSEIINIVENEKFSCVLSETLSGKEMS